VYKSSSVFKEQTYAYPKTGMTYHVAYWEDHHMASPDKEHDCHGVTYEMQNSVEDILEADDLSDDLRLRLPLFRELHYEHGTYLYYDVIASINKAVTVWGCSPEDAPAQVEQDYEYLRGWYQDDWSWIGITVTKIVDDVVTDDYVSVGGFESFILRDDEELSSTLHELVGELESNIRHEQHKGQLELSFA
jgi:hypothetical protein